MTASDPILVINCGSASSKVALFDAKATQRLCEAIVDFKPEHPPQVQLTYPELQPLAIEPDVKSRGITSLVTLFREQGWLPSSPAAVGHRVVHGGERFHRPQLINDDVIREIDAATALAPLHNPINLAGIRASQQLFPARPQVAVFDTAFHQSLPPSAYLYAVPMDWYRHHRIRRYGFHGTSHHYILEETARRLKQPPEATCIISAHLGNGCSITAIDNGKSVDTSMGFTPLEGLVMGTRSGDLDPGLFEYLIGLDYTPEEINTALNRQSGLMGLSELSSDMRSLEKARSEGHAGAMVAIDVFCARLGRYIGAMMAALPRLDALVFTGGIGENSTLVRELTLDRLKLLGFELDPVLNRRPKDSPQGFIHRDTSHTVMVIPTDEQAMIARQSLQTLEQVKA